MEARGKMSRARMSGLVAALLVAGSACSDSSVEPVEDGDVISEAQLVAHLTFAADGSDVSGNGNDGTVVGTLSGGILTVGANATDHLAVPASTLAGATDFTVAAWIRIESLRPTDFHVLMSLATAADDNSFILTYRPFAESWLAQWTGGGNSFDQDTTVEDGAWHHVVFTREADIIRLYLDGVELSAELITTAALAVDAGGLVFGQDQDAVGGSFEADESWAGSIDELRIYRRAVTEAEALALATAGR